MQVQSRVFWVPKDPGFAEEYEDACAIDLEAGRAAVADGVSSAIFSGIWARILTAASVTETPDVSSAGFWDWLAARRQEWAAAIDPASLTFFQRGKLQQCGGAFATLLWLQWQTGGDRLSWTGAAIGDSGLLHVRDRDLLTAFPISAANELHADPLTLASTARSADRLLEFRSAEGVAEPGDWLILTTDALLGWALGRYEAGWPPDWHDLWTWSDDEFAQAIERWRSERSIRTDDTTVILLRVEADDDLEPAMEPEVDVDYGDAN